MGAGCGNHSTNLPSYFSPGSSLRHIFSLLCQAAEPSVSLPIQPEHSRGGKIPVFVEVTKFTAKSALVARTTSSLIEIFPSSSSAAIQCATSGWPETGLSSGGDTGPCPISRAHLRPQSFDYTPEARRQFEEPEAGIERAEVHVFGEVRGDDKGKSTQRGPRGDDHAGSGKSSSDVA
jgi:hypothetical protein